jgi:hypothetical protein
MLEDVPAWTASTVTGLLFASVKVMVVLLTLVEVFAVAVKVYVLTPELVDCV